jgi:hypothetical protein
MHRLWVKMAFLGLSIAWPPHSSRGLLAATLALLSGGFQLAIAFCVYLRLSPRKHVARRHVTDGAVQPDMVITIHILLDQAFCVFQ